MTVHASVWDVAAAPPYQPPTPPATGGVVTPGPAGLPIAIGPAPTQTPTPPATQGASHQAAGCRVPSLQGRTLKAARRALMRAHCRVGRVTRRRDDRHRASTVIRQGARKGRRLPAGAKVSVVLARR
jgi:hypothetical protein